MPSIIELNFDDIAPMPPEEALEFFRALYPDMAVTPEFAEFHRRRSFTMAHKADEAMLVRVQNRIADYMEQGASRQQLLDDIESILDNAGVTPANPQYAEMVVRTNMMDAFNEGISAEMRDPTMQEFFPVWEYVGIEDGREGGDHRPHFGKFFRNDVPFAEVRDSLVMKNGEPVPATSGEGRPFNCRCVQRIISKYEWAELQAAGARVEAWR